MTTNVRIFMALEVELFFNKKHNFAMMGVMTSHASNHVLSNMWSYHFYDIMLSTDNRDPFLVLKIMIFVVP